MHARCAAIGSNAIETPAEVTPGDLLIAAFEVDADPSSLAPPIGSTLVRDR